jgi:hypothetical protein
MPQSSIVISRRPVVAGLVLLVALSAAAGTARPDAAPPAADEDRNHAAAGDAFKRGPRIVGVKGFAFRPKRGDRHGLRRWS